MIDTNDDNEEVKVSKDGQIDKRGKNWLLEKTLEGQRKAKEQAASKAASPS